MKNLGVNVSHTHLTKDVTTGIAQISVAENGENQIVIVAGANNSLSKLDVDLAKDLIRDADLIIGQLETPFETTLEAFKLNNGVSYVLHRINTNGCNYHDIVLLRSKYTLTLQIKLLNAAPARTDIGEILPYCTILCVNEPEASLIVNFEVELS